LIFSLAAGRVSGFRFLPPRALQKLSPTQTSRARGGVPWSEATRTFPTRARSAQGTSNVRQGATPNRQRRWIAPLHPNRAKRSAARRGSQSAYKARPRRPIATSAFKFAARVDVSNTPL
jgi:hypothetical protein